MSAEETSLQAIEAAIADLYRQAEMPRPRTDRSVAPLGELLRGLRLARAEMPALTSRKAEAFLLRWGGLYETQEAVGWANDDPLAGFLYAGAAMGCLFVEQSDLVVRRRFSAAHELGHYLLHFRPRLFAAESGADAGLEWATDATLWTQHGDESGPPEAGRINTSECGLFTLPPLEQMEQEANAFAAALLMPAELVQTLADIYRQDFRGEDLVWRLSTQMLVSRWAMRRRLHDLGLLAPDADDALPGRN